MMMEISKADLYLPHAAEILDIIEENSEIKTFVLSFQDKAIQSDFFYKPGQFVMVSVPHCGEAPISFSSSPNDSGRIELSVRRAGKLTTAMHEMAKGDIVGLRGPYGRSFPMEKIGRKKLLFIAGGIGLAPLRSVISTCLSENTDQEITLFYGSRSPSDIAFKKDIAKWQAMKNVSCLLTVDRAEKGWDGRVGLVTSLFGSMAFKPDETLALICGPPMMLKAVFRELGDQGFADSSIITTMERHMICGVGVCRHCHMDEKLVCLDGPIFSLEELKNLDVMELR